MRTALRRAWMIALLPVFFLPLRAQESPEPAQVPAPAPAPSPTPGAPPASPPPATDAPPADAESGPGEERVSADNNLSFPVDI